MQHRILEILSFGMTNLTKLHIGVASTQTESNNVFLYSSLSPFHKYTGETKNAT